MARSRNIKPGILDNEELAALSPYARLLFIYLWMLADKSGRLEDRPARIKKQALGYDSVDANELLQQLSDSGFIERYEVDGNRLIQIVNFEKHQSPHVREQASQLPGLEDRTDKAVIKHNQGSAIASPRSPDSLIPDSLLLIPDSNVSADASCSEPIVSEPEEPPVIEILTNKKNELAKITHSQYDRWVETYPAVDVWQTLLRIKSWAEANPAKRKTNKGMARFIDSWLAREQDKPKFGQNAPPVLPGLTNVTPGTFLNSRERNALRNAEIFDYHKGTDFGDPHCE